MNKVSKNFYDWEIIPPSIYNNPNLVNSWFYTPFMFQFPQFVRDRFGHPVFINTYMMHDPYALGDIYRYSGYRTPNCAIGAPLSQHKFKAAVDIKIPAMSVEEIIKDIQDNYKLYKGTGLTTIELGTKGWIHGDSRETNQDTLYEVKFYKKEN